MPRSQRPIIALLFILLITTQSAAYQQIETVQEITGQAEKKEQRLLSGPRAVAVSGEKIYIADTGANRIVVTDHSGKVLLKWGEKGNKPGQFKAPSGIAVDEHNRVYVSDTGNGRIQVFDENGKWIRGFGVKGSGPREFSEPSGITAAKGTLYIADTGNARVQILTSEGIFIGRITVKTKGDELKAPVDVAVDVQNRLYVLDSDANNVRIFDPAGAQLAAFGAKGKGADGFDSPQSIAVDTRGNIYVTDAGNFKLKKFDMTGKLLGSVGSKGDGRGQFREASGLDVDRSGKAFVLDSEKNSLQIFTCETGDGKPLVPASPPPSVAFNRELKGEVSAIALNKRAWAVSADSLNAIGVYEGRKIGAPGSEPGLLKKPRGLAVDSQGNFLVADTGNNRIQKFSLEGNLLQVLGKSGAGEAEFKAPSGVALSPKGNVCVADTGNGRIQVFSPKGAFLGAFGKSGKLAGQFSEPVDLATDGSENIYVVDRANNRISKYDGAGALMWETGKQGSGDGEFSGPENILVSPDNEVYVLDSGNGRVQVFDTGGRFLRKFGSPGKDLGEFRSPVGLALEDGNRLYVGDKGNARVQVFTIRHTPSVPKEITAQASPNEIQIAWKPNVETYLEQYRIYRADSPAGEFRQAAVSAEPFYIDKALPSSKAFHYRVSSQAREGNESAASDAVSAVTPRLMPSTPRKVKIAALEKQVTLSWLPNTEPFMSQYRVYRSTKMDERAFELVAGTDKAIYLDAPLADETIYYYKVTAVGKEGDESPAGEVVFAATPRASLSLPPLEITRVELGEIFASAYKYYEANPLGKALVKNNTDRVFHKVKVSFSIKEFMDFPTEQVIPEIRPGQQMELLLKPVFSNRILEVTENTPLQSELALTYYIAGEPKVITRRFPVTLYERHAMTWDRKAKIGAFVTPRDQAVADFSRSVIQPYVDAYQNLPSSLVYARAVYAALGVMGLKYVVDPTSPFREFSEKTASVDYIQYPRDTLTRKSGDCDDLSILFAASMENIGIGTALVDVPGHVFIMFNTGVYEKDKDTLGFPDPLLVAHQGTVWIPVEMTLVGASFTRAWQKAAEEYGDWSAKGKVDIVSIQKAWEQFRPATLPNADVKFTKVKREEIEAKYKAELETLGRQRLANLSEGYIAALKKNPKDMTSLAQLGVLYGENGLHTEALEQFQKMLAVDKNNAVALNNIGNISFLQGRLDDAKQAYESALKVSPDDPGIMVNLARILYQLNKKDDAKAMFHKAAEIDPRVLRQYGDLAASLGIAK